MNEAFSTLSGSLSMAKGAWNNLVTGLADDSADLDMLIGNFVESVGAVATQLIPKIGTALNGASKLVRDLIPVIVQEIPSIINDNLPVLAEAAVSIIQSLVDGISQNQKSLLKTATQTITYLAKSFVKLLPKITKLGLDILISLAKGISKSLKELTPTIVDVIIEIVDILTDPKTLNNLFDAALEIIETLSALLLKDDVLDGLIDSAVKIIISIADFIGNNIEKLFSAAVKIITGLANYLLDPENLAKIAFSAVKIIASLGNALENAVEGLSSAVAEIIAWIVKKFTGIDLSESGKEAMKTFFMGMLGFAKRADVGKFIEDAATADKIRRPSIGSQIKRIDYDPYDVGIGKMSLTDATESGYGGTSIGNITINIDGAKYSDEHSLAEAIAYEIQNMTERRAAVYA
jgi:hypothetical protein